MVKLCNDRIHDAKVKQNKYIAKFGKPFIPAENKEDINERDIRICSEILSAIQASIFH